VQSYLYLARNPFFGLELVLLRLIHSVAVGGLSAPHYLSTFLFKTLLKTIWSFTGSVTGINTALREHSYYAFKN